jgi:hypothetical protein
MEELLLLSADGESRLLFSDREPFDRDQPLEGFSVRITVRNLTAEGRVCADRDNGHPASLFAEVARQWRGWPGELSWESMENELELRCTHDKLGHVRLRVRLGRSWDWPGDWQVWTAVTVEGGQLDRLATEAAAFFGQPNSK